MNSNHKLVLIIAGVLALGYLFLMLPARSGYGYMGYNGFYHHPGFGFWGGPGIYQERNIRQGSNSGPSGPGGGPGAGK